MAHDAICALELELVPLTKKPNFTFQIILSTSGTNNDEKRKQVQKSNLDYNKIRQAFAEFGEEIADSADKVYFLPNLGLRMEPGSSNIYYNLLEESLPVFSAALLFSPCVELLVNLHITGDIIDSARAASMLGRAIAMNCWNLRGLELQMKHRHLGKLFNKLHPPRNEAHFLECEEYGKVTMLPNLQTIRLPPNNFLMVDEENIREGEGIMFEMVTLAKHCPKLNYIQNEIYLETYGTNDLITTTKTTRKMLASVSFKHPSFPMDDVETYLDNEWNEINCVDSTLS